MKLIPVPDKAGNPIIWINADHLVSVSPLYRGAAQGVELAAELKVDGMPLQRVALGEYHDRAAAAGAFEAWLKPLQEDR